MDLVNNKTRHRSPISALVAACLGIIAGSCSIEDPRENLGTTSSAATTGLCGYYPFPSGHVGPSAPPCIGACYSDGNGGHCTDPGDSQRFLIAYGCAVKTNGE